MDFGSPDGLPSRPGVTFGNMFDYHAVCHTIVGEVMLTEGKWLVLSVLQSRVPESLDVSSITFLSEYLQHPVENRNHVSRPTSSRARKQTVASGDTFWTELTGTVVWLILFTVLHLELSPVCPWNKPGSELRE